MPSLPSLLTQISSGLRQNLDIATAGFTRLAIRLLLRVLHASNYRIDNGILVLCGWIVLAGSRREREMPWVCVAAPSGLMLGGAFVRNPTLLFLWELPV